MKKQLQLILTFILSICMTVSISACGKPKTFEEACEGLKNEITSKDYFCDFEFDDVYGRPIYMITVYTKGIDGYSYSDTLAYAALVKFKNEFLPYIEENFSTFTDESIFVMISSFDNNVYESGCAYIYGYYAK